MALKITQIDDACTGCGACVSACSKQALTLVYNEEGFYYPALDQDMCVNCNLCERVCQVLNNPESPHQPSVGYSAYMIKSKDKDIVRKSSSGGIFSNV